MKIEVIINILAMIILVAVLYRMQQKYVPFTKRVFTGLGLGIVFGVLLQLIYGVDSVVTKESVSWFNIIGTGYVKLLQMIVMPLILVSITSAITNMKDTKSLGKFGGLIIGVLVLTTAISAVVGVGSALGFRLSAVNMEAGDKENKRSEYLESRKEDATVHISEKITEIIPSNPFLAMTGQGKNSTLSVVLFSTFTGIAVLGIQKKKPKSAELFKDMINATHDVVMRVVTLILRLTPFGIMALMTKTIGTSNVQEIAKLGTFIVASYIAIILMFVVHLVIIALVGLNPIMYIKKSLPVLTFAFTSRTSAGAVPMNIETQTKKLGIPESIASLAASFGTSIGQNGCAGIYPAMLAVMIAPTVGINPLDVGFLFKLIVIVAVSSFGVAGVGGGATFAALIVLSSMGLPVGLAGLLISIEPLIDMGRTALNVSGSLVAGIVTSRVLKETNIEIYNDTSLINIEDAQ